MDLGKEMININPVKMIIACKALAHKLLADVER